MTEKAAIYKRVSGTSQEDNSSLDAQSRRCHDYCVGQGYTVIAERKEVISGVLVLARSIFNELLELAADGQLDVIVVDIPDRLGRGDAIAKLELLAQLNGARVEYAQPGRDSSTLEGLALKATEQLVSGIERLNFRRRSRDGKYSLARSGQIIAPSTRPYGYNIQSTYGPNRHKTSCQLVINEPEAQIVRRLYELCLHGETTYKIALTLNKEGIPSQKGGRWSPDVVLSLLRNRRYKGEWIFGRRESKRTDAIDKLRISIRHRPDEEVIVVPCPPIVSQEVWELAQKKLTENRRAKFRKPTRHKYLLRGRLRCAKCGGKYYGCINARKAPHPQGDRYYYCGRNRSEHGAAKRCDARQIKADRIEAVVWNSICEAMLDEARLIAGAKRKRIESSKARSILTNTIAANEALNDKAREKLRRFENLFGEGEMDKDRFITHKRTIAAEIAERDAECANLLQRLSEYPNITPEFEQELIQFRSEIAARMKPDLPFEAKVRLLELLDVQVVLDREADTAVVSGLLGTSTLLPSRAS